VNTEPEVGSLVARRGDHARVLALDENAGTTFVQFVATGNTAWVRWRDVEPVTELRPPAGPDPMKPERGARPLDSAYFRDT
jgi:hypothetical protein